MAGSQDGGRPQGLPADTEFFMPNSHHDVVIVLNRRLGQYFESMGNTLVHWNHVSIHLDWIMTNCTRITRSEAFQQMGVWEESDLRVLEGL